MGNCSKRTPEFKIARRETPKIKYTIVLFKKKICFFLELNDVNEFLISVYKKNRNITYQNMRKIDSEVRVILKISSDENKLKIKI